MSAPRLLLFTLPKPLAARAMLGAARRRLTPCLATLATLATSSYTPVVPPPLARRNETFARYIHTLLEMYGGTKKEFAFAVQMRPSALSRVLAGLVPDVPKLLLIARVTQTPPDALLRAAGLPDVADTLRACYGAPVTPSPFVPTLRADDDRWLRRLRRLTAAQRRALAATVSAFEQAHDQAHAQRRRA